MTRDEAVVKFHGAFFAAVQPSAQFGSYNWNEALVSGLVSLGVLKLDDPEQEIKDAAVTLIKAAAGQYSGLSPQGIVDLLYRNGYKITR